MPIKYHEWPHIKDLTLADPTFYIENEIDILLGDDVFMTLISGTPIMGPQITYGTSCAPFLAIRTLKQLCVDEKHCFPQAAMLSKDNFYIDDLLAGADSLDSARKIVHELQHLMVNFHAGKELVLSLIRQKIWLPYGKSAVKKELRNYIYCFKLVAKPVSQMMGDLPIERINPCHSFEKVGIDFAGPVTTKCQHTRKMNNFKSYICLFICMCTKAAHLELISSLSAALRRFVSRRGYPSNIYSNNGTDFVGASAYLKDLFQLLHSSNVQEFRQARTFSGTSSLHMHRISEVCGRP
ncbi:integrase catalytic domain-containing protein [Trichonephila clavipes]|nr:integrase catalytic domain-containing protein [Trichonephila clavipes]